MMHLTGAQHVTFATALKRAGYQGKVAGGAGLGAGHPEADGRAGRRHPVPDRLLGRQHGPEDQDVRRRLQGQVQRADPSPYAADAYDAMQLIIKSLAASKSFESDAIKAGMEKVAGEGFDGAAGNVTFENRDARVPGVLVEWRGGKENVIQP